MTAVEHLEVKLARSQVKTHLRRTRGKVGVVTAYVRDLDFTIDGTVPPFEEEGVGNWVRVEAKNRGRVVGYLDLIDEYEDQTEFSVTQVHVAPSQRHKGVADALALKFHKTYPKAKLLHGSFTGKAGQGWASHMLSRYKAWNERHPDFGYEMAPP